MADKTDGLPDVDLTPVIKDLKTQNQDKGEKTEGTETPEGEETLDLGQFKNPNDMLKSYKEIQGAFTKVTQRNKDLEKAQAERDAEVAELRDQVEMMRSGQNYSSLPDSGSDKTFDVRLSENAESTIQQVVANQLTTMSIAEVLEEEADKNRGEFTERYAEVKHLAQEYPHLAKTGRGVKKLFEKADKTRMERTRRNVYQSLEQILGEPPTDEQLNRFKTMIKGESTTERINTGEDKTNAFMPDTTSTRRNRTEEDTKPDYGAKGKEAAQKGDLDGALDAAFKEALNS